MVFPWPGSRACMAPTPSAVASASRRTPRLGSGVATSCVKAERGVAAATGLTATGSRSSDTRAAGIDGGLVRRRLAG